MRARLRGLTAFYTGDFWLARRSEANALMLEHHNVHLLRPLGSIGTLTGGARLEDRASEPAGALPPDTGLVVADFYHAERGELEHLVELFEARVQPALLAEDITSSDTSWPSSRPTTIRGSRSSRTIRSFSSSPPTEIVMTATACGASGGAPARPRVEVWTSSWRRRCSRAICTRPPGP